ncbi:MAG: hypothetical protein EFT35_07585 [Methanophagales archaeon ANME-1-THS]|nr:MAG: hypothetical protein EFT35_07585 [Methanophagales archaeon ANME-1-THS]
MTIHRASGFALNGTNFHVLRIHIVEALNPQPLYLKSLLETKSNSTERRIRENNKTQGSNHRYRGYLRLGGEDYNLAGMIIMYENGKTRNYTADIVSQSGSVRVGTISVILRTHEGARIGEGSLTMNHTRDPCVYRVLLAVDEG